jgi:hypothetical protein
MQFKVYIDREGTTWPPPEHAPGEPIIIDVERETPFGDAVAAGLRAAGQDVEALYYIDGSGPHYWAQSLENTTDSQPRLVAFPRVVITADGQLLWMWGARDTATFSDFERARDAGYFEGDPYGVFLERPMYGDGVIPGWEELFEWLAQAAVGGAGTVLVGLLRKHYRRWRERGATTAYAYLDIVLARSEWRRDELARLLGLSAEEGRDLLQSFGFRPEEDDTELWRPSNDPDASELRKKILHDFMHHPEEEGNEDEDEDEDDV